jgi:hypothetical protein
MRVCRLMIDDCLDNNMGEVRSPVKEPPVQVLPQAIAMPWLHVALAAAGLATRATAHASPTMTAGVCEWSRVTTVLNLD